MAMLFNFHPLFVTSTGLREQHEHHVLMIFKTSEATGSDGGPPRYSRASLSSSAAFIMRISHSDHYCSADPLNQPRTMRQIPITLKKKRLKAHGFLDQDSYPDLVCTSFISILCVRIYGDTCRRIRVPRLVLSSRHLPRLRASRKYRQEPPWYRRGA